MFYESVSGDDAKSQTRCIMSVAFCSHSELYITLKRELGLAQMHFAHFHVFFILVN